jgi:Icc protein
MMPLAKKCLSILQLSDTHILATPETTLLGVNTAYYFKAVLAQAFSDQHTFDLIMLTGDLAQDPVLSSYQFLLHHMESYGVPVICLPGNHDDYTLMLDIFNTQLVSCRKQTVLDHWQVISLNSQIIGEEGGYLSAYELLLLEESIKQYPDHHAMIAVHHHCLASESVWMDTMMIANSEEFLSLIQRYPQAKAIINGHIHQEMDKQVSSVQVLGTPSTCFQFKPKSVNFALDDTLPAYRHLQLYPDGRIATQVIRLRESLIGLENTTHGY